MITIPGRALPRRIGVQNTQKKKFSAHRASKEAMRRRSFVEMTILCKVRNSSRDPSGDYC